MRYSRAGLRGLALCAALLAALPAPRAAEGSDADADARQHIEIPRVPRPPRLEDFLEMRPAPDLDGHLGRASGFVQRDPEDGQPASQHTEVYLGYDADHLYVVFVAFDEEPDKIRAHVSRRENVLSDETVEIQLDTFLDQRRAFSFFSNPLGVQADAIWTERGDVHASFDFSWDAVWQSRGRITDQGYVVWMAIPFESLRFPRVENQTWGVVFNRDIPRNNESSFWPHISSRIEGRLNQAGTLGGLRGIASRRNMQVIPYVTARRLRALDENDSDPEFARDGFDPDMGVDAKFVFKDRLALDLTANPDFSQVESDLPQTTVNQRFEVFFPEKRPFFLENADLFQTPFNLFFTRRIAEPRAGLRLSGKVGKYSIGALVIDDESPGETVDPSDPMFDRLNGERAWFGVARLSRDISQQSRIGLLFTDREFDRESNRVGGIDGRIKLNEHWVGQFQVVHSSTETLDGESLSDPAFDLQFDREGRGYTAHNHYLDIGREFRADAGFVPRTDFREAHTFHRYTFRPEGKRLISWGPDVFLTHLEDQDGTRLDWRVDPEMSWQFRRQTSLRVVHRVGADRLRAEDIERIVEPSDPNNPPVFTQSRDFDIRQLALAFDTSFADSFSADLDLTNARGINFVPPPDQEPGATDESRGSLALTMRPGSRARILTSYLFTRLTDRASDRWILTNRIGRVRFDWQFDRRLSLRTIVQHDRTSVDPALTRLETTKEWNVDLLLTYLVNPWTSLFVGYNTNYKNIELIEDPAGNRLLRTRNDFLNDGRQLFLKFSYLFRP